MKHIHADLIKKWVDDMTVVVQYQSMPDVWVDVEPTWYPEYKYRIKPKMVSVGRHSWPEPLKSVIDGTMYTFNFITGEVHEAYGLQPSTLAIIAGAAHDSRESAQMHLDALICISKGDIE
jgi:hypothetical protein